MSGELTGSQHWDEGGERLAQVDASWRGLYRVGGVAALLAAVVFRRNLGVEVGLFSASQPAPESVAGWLALLHSNRLLGLVYLNFFDVVNYVLLALMFVALAAALWRHDKSRVTMGATLALLGIATYLATNTALSLLALSEQYAVAGEAEQAALRAAGQALLALNRFGAGAHPGAGGYASLLFIAAGGLLLAAVMLRSGLFGRVTAVTGITANALDLGYCVAYAAAPAAAATLALIFIPAAGLFLMLWHLLVGWRLLRLNPAITAQTAASGRLTSRR